MPKRTTRLLLVLAILVACRGPAPELDRGTCTHLEASRRVRGVALCEDVWTCDRPPGGPHDRLGIRHLAPCGNLIGPVAFVLPDRHASSETGQTDADADVRLYLAQAGVQTWSLDYRTHGIGILDDDPAAIMAEWTHDTFVGDVVWAVAFVRGVSPKPLALVGIGDGATLAYAAAAVGVPGIAGVVAIDGALEPAPAVDGSTTVVEARVGTLDREAGERLVRFARLGARNPSPIPGFVTAGEALADALHRAPGWGAPGGLASATMVPADPTVIARYLASQDRWWPAAVARHAAPAAPPRPLPVLAFAAGARGEEWIRRVQAAATAFAGDRADVRVLGGQGHLDVILGRQAVRRVYEPTRQWLGE